MGLSCVWNFCRIFWSTILDWSSFAVLHNKFLQNTRFKLTLKQTLSKPKPKLIVLIMVCQHIQNEILIDLVPKVLYVRYDYFFEFIYLFILWIQYDIIALIFFFFLEKLAAHILDNNNNYPS